MQSFIYTTVFVDNHVVYFRKIFCNKDTALSAKKLSANNNSIGGHLLFEMHYINFHMIIGLDKGGYPVNIFLISPRKHMLWVLIRSASARRF